MIIIMTRWKIVIKVMTVRIPTKKPHGLGLFPYTL